jgi:hypothetical protein
MFQTMDSKKEYINLLSSYLEDGTLFSLFEEYENDSVENLTVIKRLRISELPMFLDNIDLHLNEQYIDFCNYFMYMFDHILKDECCSLNFIIIFELKIEFNELIKNLPEYSHFIGNIPIWRDYGLPGYEFMEDVKALLHTIPTKPAKK